MQPEQINLLSSLTAVEAALPLVEEYQKRSEERIIRQVSQKITNGSLTGEEALAAWGAFLQCKDIARQLRNTLKEGRAQGSFAFDTQENDDGD